MRAFAKSWRRQVKEKPRHVRAFFHTGGYRTRRQAVPRERLHDLRHSHATHLLASGIHPKVAQERLGHASVAITLDLYSHVLPGMQAEAADRVDLAVREAINRRLKAKG